MVKVDSSKFLFQPTFAEATADGGAYLSGPNLSFKMLILTADWHNEDGCTQGFRLWGQEDSESRVFLTQALTKGPGVTAEHHGYRWAALVQVSMPLHLLQLFQ